MSRPSSTAPGGDDGEGALLLAERGSEPRHDRDARRGFADRVGGEAVSVERVEIERCRGGDGGRLVVEIVAGRDQPVGDGAVGQAGIEMAEPEMLGEPARERALAACRRTVDGNDRDVVHAASAPFAKPAPRRVRISTKLGNEVAIVALSSTLTGRSAASPMTRKLMAMR